MWVLHILTWGFLMLSQLRRGACRHLDIQRLFLYNTVVVQFAYWGAYSHNVVSRSEKSQWPIAAFLSKCIVFIKDS